MFNVESYLTNSLGFLEGVFKLLIYLFTSAFDIFGELKLFPSNLGTIFLKL